MCCVEKKYIDAIDTPEHLEVVSDVQPGPAVSSFTREIVDAGMPLSKGANKRVRKRLAHIADLLVSVQGLIDPEPWSCDQDEYDIRDQLAGLKLERALLETALSR